MNTDRPSVRRLTDAFMDAFNRNDLDAVMGYFAEDGVYDQFNGRLAEGREAVRAAFEPQFAGAFGAMRFLTEDCFVDEAAGKAMVSWICELEQNGEPTAWRGLDILVWRGGKLAEKLTYAKAKAPLFDQSLRG